MSFLQLGDIFQDPIRVSLKEGSDLTYFRDNGFCDYRCGCDLCCRGDAIGLQTNIWDFRDRDNFLLNDLTVEVSEEEDTHQLYTWYETTHPKLIAVIEEWYHRFQQSTGCEVSTHFSLSKNMTYPYTSIIIDSLFKCASLPKCCKICANCYRWLGHLYPDYQKHLQMVNPLKYFWLTMIKEYLFDQLNFTDHRQESLFVLQADSLIGTSTSLT